ncbi:MAG: NAD-dependent deacetylase [Kiritimatiellia bacterium]|jgi:NAD-dependent deacetylase
MQPLSTATGWARQAERILVITGAGLSADSGLPTYRGVGGLYEDAHTADGVPIEVALSGRMLRTRPEVCWRHIAQIERACRGATFNAAHVALVDLEQHAQVVIVTQNVDGFHVDAGSSRVIEVHGTLRNLHCVGCRRTEIRRDFTGMSVPPLCEVCGALVRPDVVLFGESLPSKAMYAWGDELRKGFDLVMTVGTSSGFQYIAEPVIEARRRGTPTIEINPGHTSVSDVVVLHWKERAAVALPALIEALG